MGPQQRGLQEHPTQADWPSKCQHHPLDAVHTPDGACLTTTPGGSSHTLPTSGATAEEARGEGSHS